MGFYHQIDRGFRLKFSHHPIETVSMNILEQCGLEKHFFSEMKN